MIKSMTGFSRKDESIRKTVDDTKKNIVIGWEIRSVNHRYLDISLSLPEGLNVFENKFKERIRNKLGRGKVDAKLTYSVQGLESKEEIALNKDKIKALLSARHMLEAISKKPVSLSGMDILTWPGVLEKETDLSAYYVDEIFSLLDATLDELIEYRETEGERLIGMIEPRCAQIVELVETVRARRPIVMAALREKVLKKLSELDVNTDPNRLEQELVFQAQRLDVDEELDRLGAHIDEVREVLKRREPVGRRLDFLMQELHREANTLASKSNDAETTRASVDLKVLIEQMREQMMNIE